MYREQEWREVWRLHKQGVTKAEIARRLSMSRTTIQRLLKLECPPRYRRNYRADESLRLLARALLATARDMLERERHVSGLETATAQVSASGANSGHPGVDEN